MGHASDTSAYAACEEQFTVRVCWGECQKPGALRRELDCLLAEASVQHRRPDLKNTMGAAR